MILPIVAYGHPVLRRIADSVTSDFPDLQQLIADMWETMYHSNGVGLAAPQINRSVRIFVIDTIQVVQDFDDEDKKKYPNEIPRKITFINAQKVEDSGELWKYNEGCLSVPKIREDIERTEKVRLRYMDESFKEYEEEFDGIMGRVIQHEYDHIEGKLFIDYLPQVKKKMIKKKLDDISRGKVKMDYKMLYPK